MQRQPPPGVQHRPPAIISSEFEDVEQGRGIALELGPPNALVPPDLGERALRGRQKKAHGDHEAGNCQDYQQQLLRNMIADPDKMTSDDSNPVTIPSSTLGRFGQHIHFSCPAIEFTAGHNSGHRFIQGKHATTQMRSKDPARHSSGVDFSGPLPTPSPRIQSGAPLPSAAPSYCPPNRDLRSAAHGRSGTPARGPG